ncbi:MAG: ATP-binding protein [Bacteroidota bacterium]|nr:ATP-binding protein [Bacteroidota bacterium]
MDQVRNYVSKENSIIKNQLLYISKRLYTHPYIKTLLNAGPEWILIFTNENELVFANDAVLSFFEMQDITTVLGKRPGEVLQCSYVHESGELCGEGVKCMNCNLFLSMEESRKHKRSVSSHLSLGTMSRQKSIFTDIRISPFDFENKELRLVHIRDASYKRKSENLEKILLQKASGSIESVKGYLDFLKEIPDRKSMDQYIATADHISNELKEELEFLKALEILEKDDYVMKKSNLESVQFIYNLLKNIEHSSYAEGKRFIMDVGSEEFNITTDPFLLKIVLNAMFKNAMEATEPGGSIKLGVASEDKDAFIWVANKTAIPERVQLHIYEKYYTTKKGAMGIGAYIMKLITEEYLSGSIYFESSKEKGTFFSVRIPQIKE